jgi:hypothetical protein
VVAEVGHGSLAFLTLVLLAWYADNFKGSCWVPEISRKVGAFWVLIRITEVPWLWSSNKPQDSRNVIS